MNWSLKTTKLSMISTTKQKNHRWDNREEGFPYNCDDPEKLAA